MHSRNFWAAQVGFSKVLQPQTAQTNIFCLFDGHFPLSFHSGVYKHRLMISTTHES